MSKSSKDEKNMSRKSEQSKNTKPEAPAEKITAVYDNMKTKDETRFSNRCANEFKINETRETHIKNIFEKETDNKKTEFSLIWFEDHKAQLGEEGVPSNIELSDNVKIKIAIEKGALDELEINDEYKEHKIELENIYAIRKDFNKGNNCPIESRFLALNMLNKRMERKQKEIKAEIENENPRISYEDLEGEVKKEIYQNKEIQELYEDMKELTGKITGLDLDEKAKEKIGFLPSKEDFINTTLLDQKEVIERKFKSKIFEEEYKEFEQGGKNIFIAEKIKQWEKNKIPEDMIKKLINDFDKVQDIEDFANISLEEDKQILKVGFEKEQIDEETILALRNAGYDPKDFKRKRSWKWPLFGKGEGIFTKIWFKRNTIKLKKGEKIKIKDFEGFCSGKKEIFNNDISNKADKKLEAKYTDEIKPEYKVKLEKEIQNQIENIAESPKNAIDNIEGLFKTIKERQLDEFIEKAKQKKIKKLAEKKETVEKLETGYEESFLLDVPKIMFNAVNTKQALEQTMQGNFDFEDENDPNLIKFHEHLTDQIGIDRVSENNILKFMEQDNAPDIRESIKSERGWLDYILDLILFAFNSEAEQK